MLQIKYSKSTLKPNISSDWRVITGLSTPFVGLYVLSHNTPYICKPETHYIRWCTSLPYFVNLNIRPLVTILKNGSLDA